MRCCSTRRWRAGRLGQSAEATSASAAPSGEKVGAGVAMFVEKSGLGPFDTVRIEVIARRHGRGRHRRRLDRPGRRNRDRANLRRRARRRLRHHQRHPRPDRPHRQGHRRLCLARHGDVRRSHAAGRHQTSRAGAARRRRADADRAPRTRHRQRRDRPHRRHGPSMPLGALARGHPRWPIRRGYVRVHAHGLPLRRPHRGGARRCRHRRRDYRALC